MPWTCREMTHKTLRQGVPSIDGRVLGSPDGLCVDGLIQVHGEVGMILLDLRLDVLVTAYKVRRPQ